MDHLVEGVEAVQCRESLLDGNFHHVTGLLGIPSSLQLIAVVLRMQVVGRRCIELVYQRDAAHVEQSGLSLDRVDNLTENHNFSEVG